ncbi:MAG TPA: YiiX/YebB-like N1pC/P60 family cysteine hydrolase [Bacteroidota bacterium]
MSRSLLKHRRILRGLLFLGILYLLLLIPSPSPTVPPVEQSGSSRQFIWNQDARWDSLEASYAAARKAGCAAERPLLETSRRSLETLLTRIESDSLTPDSPQLSQLESGFFSLAPLVGACPESVPAYLTLASRLRTVLKHKSEHWNLDDRSTRETIYRLLYGARSAVEEVILQTPPGDHPPALLEGTDEPSVTPSATLLGVTIHSGDILVSRGGAPTSALIARGNDFPGNFSHIALVHIDSGSGKVSIIESHIERGVVISTPEEYLHDTKLRVMVLRLRSDLPATISDPLIPHRSSSFMLRRVLERHIAYDFSMDYADSTRLFCSEVASSAYAAFGVRLWMGISHLSTPGVRSWLGDFGVDHFETQEPSDLEYDPQLRVVAEWRDPETLRKDHIDNAVTDAMLEGAERGDRLAYNPFLLPPSRFMKAYSAILNLFGIVAPVPEGMSATTVLYHKFYSERHGAGVAAVSKDAERFRAERGFEPPYWEMLKMARRALATTPG